MVHDLLEHVRHENRLEEGRGNFILVEGSRRPGESHAQASQQFFRLLDEIGVDNTPSVREACLAADHSIRTQKNRAQVVGDLVAHLEHDNGFKDGLSNFKLVHSYLEEGEERAAAGAGFFAILKQVGTSRTPDAQRMYQAIHS